MRKSVIVKRAGIAGLAASLRLALREFRVRLVEIRTQAGRLASSIEIEGLSFDAGPYILLDSDQISHERAGSVRGDNLLDAARIPFDDAVSPYFPVSPRPGIRL